MSSVTIPALVFIWFSRCCGIVLFKQEVGQDVTNQNGRIRLGFGIVG
jgi:hypothetical protein